MKAPKGQIWICADCMKEVDDSDDLSPECRPVRVLKGEIKRDEQGRPLEVRAADYVWGHQAPPGYVWVK